MAYTDVHRYLMQYFLNEGFIHKHDVATEFAKLLERENVQTNLEQVIKEINKKTERFKQRIVLGTCEHTGESYYILLNETEDSISKLQSEFSKNDIELIKLIIEEIIETGNKCIPSITVMTLLSKMKTTYSHDKAEELLKKLISLGYLYENDNSISFGIRTIYEFQIHFNGIYKENTDQCPLCKFVVFVGQTCQCCDQLFHKHCIRTYLGANNKCPSCKQNWLNSEENNPDHSRTKKSRLQ